jgi:hypothetical protein
MSGAFLFYRLFKLLKDERNNAGMFRLNPIGADTGPLVKACAV